MTTATMLERTAWIDASPAAAWAALTEPDQLAGWLLPPSLGATIVRDGDRLCVVIGGFLTADLAVIEASEPPRSMVIRGLPDRLLAIRFDLAPDGTGTCVVVTVDGFDHLQPGAAEDRLGIVAEAWDTALSNLGASVQGQPQPEPDGVVASLLGYRRRSPAMVAVERSIRIQAPRERVWAAITDPEAIGAWYSPGMVWRRSGEGVGSRLTAHDPASDDVVHTEVTEELEPPARLVTSSVAAEGVAAQRTTWTLAEEAGGTRVTITLSGFEAHVPPTPDAELEQHAFGFGMVLQNLDAYIRGADLPFPGGF